MSQNSVNWEESPAALRVSKSDTNISNKRSSGSTLLDIAVIKSDSSPLKSPTKKKYRHIHSKIDKELAELNELDQLLDDPDVLEGFLQDIEDTQKSKIEESILDEFDDLYAEIENEHKRFYRVVVENVETQACSKSKGMFEKILHTKQFLIILTDEWAYTPVHAQQTVNVIGSIQDGILTVSDESGFLVLLPDCLISCTQLADSFTCLRRAAITGFVQDVSAEKWVLLSGTILHQMFEEMMKEPLSLLQAKIKLRSTIRLYIDKLGCIGKREEAVYESLWESVEKMVQWRQKAFNPSQSMYIKQVLDVEENIWCPMFGLKGKIDATLQVQIDENLYIVPFELKTGKMTGSVSHRAQVVLYTLMMHEKYDCDINFGILYYLSSNDLQKVSVNRSEVKSIIIARNNLVAGMVLDSLPQTLNNDFVCGNCFHLQSCLSLQRVFPSNSHFTEEFLKNEKFADFLPQMNEFHLSELRKWFSILAFEESELKSNQSSMWNSKEDEFKYTLTSIRGDEYTFSTSKVGNLAIGDRLLISEIDGGFYLTNGTVVQVKSQEIVLQLSKILYFSTKHSSFKDGYQVFEKKVNGKYRLDRDEQPTQINFMRANMISLCSFDTRLRQLVIDFHAPVFSNETNRSLPSELNCEQKTVVEKCLNVHGFPGSGKSTTISHLVKQLVQRGKTILISCYTHAAVDNILCKLLDHNIRILRVSTHSRVDSRLKHYTIEGMSISTVEEFEKMYSNVQVVGVTCLSVKQSLFSVKKFDYCIIDEASQISFPVCIAAIKNAKRFVLIGDHHQLSPLVKSKEAGDLGFNQSLFEILLQKHPNACVKLTRQYRMNKSLMNISNSFVYENQMICGNDAVSDRQIKLKAVKCSSCYTDCWIERVLDPEKAFLFLDIDHLEFVAESSVRNQIEADLIGKLVFHLVERGIESDNIVLLTPYRAQVDLICNFGVESHTIDRFQGKDSEIILISCVKTSSSSSGDLLDNWRRMNVAFTRARSKMIIVGSRRGVEEHDPMKRFISLCKSVDSIYQISKQQFSHP